eukprot:TRINITY_DN15266_c0_g1_i1.p1 TRINITY_DN15266_c0_g1~~TRINITY_DN15266_c0_g1_i1.p1  ORF type:complete len:640 (+),score=147.46 TRINITY_DN15266_c0_g1_i1:75-1994(+)
MAAMETPRKEYEKSSIRRGPAWESIERALRNERDSVMRHLEVEHRGFLQKLEKEWLAMNLQYLEQQMETDRLEFLDSLNASSIPFTFIDRDQRTSRPPDKEEIDTDTGKATMSVVPAAGMSQNLAIPVAVEELLRQRIALALGEKKDPNDCEYLDSEDAASRRERMQVAEEARNTAGGGQQTAPKAGRGKRRSPAGDDSELEDDELADWHWVFRKMYRWVHSTQFEITFGLLILMNTLAMVFEIQYTGWNIGKTLQIKDIEESGSEMWPHAKLAFGMLDPFFGIAFTFEVVAKLVTELHRFAFSLPNWYDLAIVSMYWLRTVIDIERYFSPFILRVLRVARLLRLLKFVRTFDVFDSLRLLVRSVKACLATMVWSGIFVFFIMMIFAMFFCFLLLENLKDESLDLQLRQELFALFGTFDRAVLSMHEITFGNWIPISQFMALNFYRYYAFFFMFYRCFISFGVLLVVRAVFVAETIRVAQTDDEIAILQKERRVKANHDRMERFFATADHDGTGFVDFKEFKDIWSKKRVQHLLSAQDIHVSDPTLLFKVTDKKLTDTLNAAEMARGLSRLKGPAKSMDLMVLTTEVSKMQKQMAEVHKHVVGLTMATSSTDGFSFERYCGETDDDGGLMLPAHLAVVA